MRSLNIGILVLERVDMGQCPSHEQVLQSVLGQGIYWHHTESFGIVDFLVYQVYAV